MIRLQKMLIIGMVVVIRYRSTERNTVIRVGESKTLARKRVLGEEHPFMGNLVSTYKNQGRWKEAEELEVQRMKTSSKVLGEKHPDTLTSMGNLASTYGNQERWKDAGELEDLKESIRRVQQVVAITPQDHPDLAARLNNLGIMLQSVMASLTVTKEAGRWGSRSVSSIVEGYGFLQISGRLTGRSSARGHCCKQGGNFGGRGPSVRNTSMVESPVVREDG